MENIQTPDYKKIFEDIISMKCPNKYKDCESLLQKSQLSVLDIIELNKRVFGYNDKEVLRFNQKHRSYSRNDILKILNYQKENNLNNTQLAFHFKLSRNTVTKWRKLFQQNFPIHDC